MAATESSACTDDDKYFGICQDDGKFKVWDTSSGSLHQEYTPDLHLTSPCTCITWIVTARNHANHKKPQGVSSNNSAYSGGTLDVAAIGTASGSIILYSLATGKDEGKLNNGHNKTVNHLTWSRNTNLFSCGDDRSIIEWDISTRKIVSKWKTGKESARRILVLPDGKSLLSAHYTITWWNLEDKTIIKTFSGHASPSVSLTLAVQGGNDGDNYLVSAARDDVFLSAWSLDRKKNSTSTVASFVVGDAPAQVSVSSNESAGPTCVAVVTRAGDLQIFRHKLNGICPKPLKPTLTVQLRGKNEDERNPVINVKVGFEDTALVSYRTGPRLCFERMPIISKKKILVIFRQTSKKSREAKNAAISKVKACHPAQPVYMHGPKRSVQGHQQSDMPMETRLKVLELNTPANATPQANSMGQLLVQALCSKSQDMLQNVLTRREPDIIRNTVAVLPVQVISPLVKELTRRIQCKSHVSKVATLWLQCVLCTHAAQLLAISGMAATFSTMMGVIETRLQVLPPLTRLRGRLNLLVDQISTSARQDGEPFQNPMVYEYKDTGALQEQTDEEDLLQQSESEEEQWDEHSGEEMASAAENQDVEMTE